MPGIRTYALFDPKTGLAEMTMALSVVQGLIEDAPPPGALSVGERTFAVYEMTAHRADWCRLHAEAVLRGGVGRPGHLKVTGGLPHPKHTHILKGGTHAWTQGDLHPDVAAHARTLAEMSDSDLIEHLTGIKAGNK